MGIDGVRSQRAGSGGPKGTKVSGSCRICQARTNIRSDAPPWRRGTGQFYLCGPCEHRYRFSRPVTKGDAQVSIWDYREEAATYNCQGYDRFMIEN